MLSLVERPIIVLRTSGLCPLHHELVQGFVGSHVNGLTRKGIDHEAVVHQPYLVAQFAKRRRVRIGTTDNAYILLPEVFQCSLAVRMNRDTDTQP